MSLRGSHSSINSSSLENLAFRALQSDPRDDSTWLIQSIVALIALFFVFSVYQFVLSRCCQKCLANISTNAAAADDEESDAAANANKIFALSDKQRRAVLEAIYAENSKLAKDLGLIAKPQEQDKHQLRLPDGQGTSQDNCDHEVTKAAVCAGQPESCLRSEHDQSESDPTCIEVRLRSSNITSAKSLEDHTHTTTQEHLLHPSTSSDTPAAINADPGDHHAILPAGCADEKSAEGHGNVLTDEPLHHSCEPADTHSALTLPYFNCCQAEDASNLATASSKDFQFPVDDGDEEGVVKKRVVPSYSTVTAMSNTDASRIADEGELATGDDICSICLSGYVTRDLLTTSKHCSHVFHKDCIMEWLQKNDDCPICRTRMVTASEVSQAASNLVGKTRMVRAVAASVATQQQRRPSAPSRRIQRGSSSNIQAHVTPLSGTVLRSVSITFT